MKLLPEELRRHLPPLYSQENTEDPTVHAKFFTPDSNWTWFATEGSQDEDDFRFFGYVIGLRRNGGTSCSPENVGTSMIGICQGWTQSSESSRQRGRCLQQ